MGKAEVKMMHLAGLALKTRTTNADGQSGRDCGMLWQEFSTGGYFEKIPGKLNGNVLAVYHDYESDHTGSFAYFIGCAVNPDAELPEGLTALTIPEGIYEKFTATGKMPDCVADTWHKIWKTDMPRTYVADFEMYGEKSMDWNNAEVEVFIGVK